VRAVPVAVDEWLIHLYQQGKSTSQMGEFSGCCVAALGQVRQHSEERDTLQPQPHRCASTTPPTEALKQRLIGLLERRLDAAPAGLEHLPAYSPDLNPDGADVQRDQLPITKPPPRTIHRLLQEA